VNTYTNPGVGSPTKPDISGDYSTVLKVAMELTDISHDSILSQHRLTQVLIKRLQMVIAHLEQTERLMRGETRFQYEGEHEQTMAEYRFLDALIADVERSNDSFLSRYQAVQALWDSQGATKQ
jgi:predicted RNA-binding protein